LEENRIRAQGDEPSTSKLKFLWIIPRTMRVHVETLATAIVAIKRWLGTREFALGSSA